MVRGAEGADGDEGVFLAHFACDGVYLCGFEGFAECERWEDAGHALGEHGFAAAWGADEDGVVGAGGGYLECALDVCLAFDVGEVELVVVELACELGAGVEVSQRDGALVVEEVDDLFEVVGAVDFEVVDNGGFACVGGREDDAFALAGACFDGDGQCAFDGAERAVEAEFAHDDVAVECDGVDFAERAEDADGDGEVVGGAFFAEIGWCEVDDDAFGWDAVAGEFDGGDDALGAFFDGVVGEADHVEAHAGGEVDFDGDGECFDADDGASVGFYEHKADCWNGLSARMG